MTTKPAELAFAIHHAVGALILWNRRDLTHEEIVHLVAYAETRFPGILTALEVGELIFHARSDWQEVLPLFPNKG